MIDWLIINIHQECEGGLEKIRPEDHRLASRGLPMITNGDHEGRIFLSHPHTNNGLFFLLNTTF